LGHFGVFSKRGCKALGRPTYLCPRTISLICLGLVKVALNSNERFIFLAGCSI
jgi:hypothetical protein